ncbi:MAG: chromosome segregation protein SMC [Christensenellaceae bacterium]|jgi:chromosome segregation protein|nr:chromosome segregation protein SMC [Christensenellaceae bacterium]
MVNFKQIELAGFKSFADRLEIKFENGVTCIVGPNGCGKSNVADAVRWVLGEQSSKLLRGTSMQDVIFNGTERRKSLSFCEVSLVFDNTARIFNLNFDEMVITRKLYRSGESEYLINRTPCRLKDIVDALHDSGIGRDGYSIIGQGKVDEIINAKPENRRAIFEEAAGISKFKQRKIEAERKLLRTDENLTRVQDILSEVDRQLGPLKKQAENARKYLEFRDQLKHFEINTYVYQFESASDNKAKIQEKIDALSEEIALKQQMLDSANEKYNKNMDEISGIDKTMEGLHNKILELTVGIEKRTGEANVIKERIKFLSEEKKKLEEELTEQKETAKLARTHIEKTLNKRSEKQKELDTLKQQSEQTQKEYLSIVDEAHKSEEEQRGVIEALSKFSDIKSNLSALKAQKEAYSSNIKDLEKKIAGLSQKIGERQKQLTNSQDKSQKAEEKYTGLKTSLEQKTEQLEGLQKQLAENNEAVMKSVSNVAIMQNRKKVLEDMQLAYEGYAYSIKRLMQDSKNNADLKQKIVGLVSGSITIPQGFETAIEVALGSAVQNIITRNEKDSKDLINYLKRNDLGRATFLPIATMKPKTLGRDEEEFLKVKNCYGVASRIIKFDQKLTPVFESLLGRTVVVGTIDDAVELAKKSNFAFKIVTLDGDTIYPQGSMSGGSAKAITANLLSREVEIDDLKGQIAKLEANAKELMSAKISLQKTIEKLTDETDKLSDDVVKAQLSLAAENQTLEQCRIYLEEHDKERILLDTERMGIQNNIMAIDSAISKIDDGKGGVVANTGIDAKQKMLDAIKIRRDKTHERMTELRIKVAALESEIGVLDTEIQRLKNIEAAAEGEILRLSDQIAKTEDNLSSNNGAVSLSQDEKSYKENMDKLDRVKAELGSLDEHKQKLQVELKIIDEDRNNLTADMNRATGKRYQEDMALAKVDTDIEAMQERIFEEYELTYSTCLEYKEDGYDLHNGLVQTSILKKEIAKLGYVNVNAIEECKLVGERFFEMSNQADDLIKAKQDLITIITELSQEMTARFDSEFSKIQVNFSKIFRELFGGGNARLQLVESESGDPLDAGVDIIAEPPGKKLQSITLLSGGEKALTAIAILFAILRLRPMPFCLLDEIEAALDDSNVERFAKYLKRFAEDTQFIVITHRKPTMELGDRLYGVTMEEKGVSKVVAVNLSDAVANAK